VTEPKATRQSGIYSPDVIEDIQTKAELGRYRIRGFGTLRTRPMPTLDDLVFIPCTLTRIPLEGYREKCSTRTVLGTRHARKPIVLDTPVMVTGMSYGALSYNAKVALAQGASRVGSSTTTGDGGMLPSPVGVEDPTREAPLATAAPRWRARALQHERALPHGRRVELAARTRP